MRFPKTLLYAIIVATIAQNARADVSYEVKDDNNKRFEVIQMTVTPAAAPVPSLKYRLVARDVDLKPGNAVPYYYRAMLSLEQNKEAVRKKYTEDEITKWESPGSEGQPLRDLPLEKLRDVADMMLGQIGDQLAVATTRRECDWELGIEDMRGVDVVNFILPEFQGTRELARALTVKTRLEIAERHYDDAVATLRQQYRLGHDAAQVPLLVCGLIGVAIDSRSNGALIEFIGNPGSPNMYWALTELAQPPIDLQPAVRFEMEFGPRMFPFIYNAETTDRAPDEWNRMFVGALKDFGKAGELWADAGITQFTDGVGAGVAATGLALVGYPHAKEYLIAHGMDRDKVENMSVGQVIAIYSERNYRRFAEDWEKLWLVPFADMYKMHDKLEKRLADAHPLGGGEEREIIPLVSLLMPAIQSCRAAQVRLERQVAALRVIEALRLYAAEHDGRLPESLDQITTVPVPLNPATSRPFEYRLNGKLAMLTLPESDGTIVSNCRFEIEIAKNSK
jgi:hypothetical protein